MTRQSLQSIISGIKLAPQPPRPSLDSPGIVTVLDDFSEQCFRGGPYTLWPVDPQPEVIDLDSINPAFLLVESAWNGNRGSWRYQVTSPRGPGPKLVKLVEAARAKGIPTVFWNKEDPPHFEEFQRTARLFDIIFTTEASLIDSYREMAPHAHVDLLPFAASTALHRPEQVSDFRAGEVCFAGQYFRHKFVERREQMDFLFAAAANHQFAIYSRMLGGDPNYAFPEQYEQFIRGSLPYSEMVREYRRHKIFLNVNSVQDSTSMCARRVFELASAKTIVLSSFTPAIRSIYTADEVPLVSSTEEANEVMSTLIEDDSARCAMAHKAWRKTAAEHTYTHRLQKISRAVGVFEERDDAVVELITPAGLPTEVLTALAHELITQQTLPGFQWSWGLSTDDSNRLAPELLSTLRATGVGTGSHAAPQWRAAWHPGVLHGEYFLYDLALYASGYSDGSVWADPTGASRRHEDSVTDRATNGTWFSSTAHEDAAALADAALDPRFKTVTGVQCYLTSGVSTRPREGAAA